MQGETRMRERDKLSERMCRRDNNDYCNVGRFALKTCGCHLLHVMEANGTFHTRSNIMVHGYVNNLHHLPAPYFFILS
jgi:hypothetical protein